MINTVESLRGLYVALGGDIAEVANLTTIPELLTEISTVAKAAATELPAVKAADNGKVLTVVNSKWAKANLPTELPAATAADSGKSLTVNSSGKYELSEYDDLKTYFTVSGTGVIPMGSIVLPTKYNTFDKFRAFMNTNPYKTYARIKGLTDFSANDYIDVALTSYSPSFKTATFCGYFAQVSNYVTVWKKVELLLTFDSYFQATVYVSDFTPS